MTPVDRAFLRSAIAWSEFRQGVGWCLDASRGLSPRIRKPLTWHESLRIATNVTSWVTVVCESALAYGGIETALTLVPEAETATAPNGVVAQQRRTPRVSGLGPTRPKGNVVSWRNRCSSAHHRKLTTVLGALSTRRRAAGDYARVILSVSGLVWFEKTLKFAANMA